MQLFLGQCSVIFRKILFFLENYARINKVLSLFAEKTEVQKRM